MHSAFKFYVKILTRTWERQYEYVLEIADRPSRLGFPEGTLTSVPVCVYEQESIKLNTDNYFIEYNRQSPFKTFMPRCVLLRLLIK